VVTRGEVWWADLDPTVGVEIKKRRPCLIVSPPEVHDALRIVLIAPLTSRSRPAPYRVPTRFGDRDGFFLLEQIRALDKSRLRQRMGLASEDDLAAVLRTLQAIFEP
jgi:mRNA interferase MazF